MNKFQLIIHIIIDKLSFTKAEEFCTRRCITSLQCLIYYGKYLGECKTESNETLVCCQLTELIIDKLISVDELIDTPEDISIYIDNNCGIQQNVGINQRPKRIVGGTTAIEADHPWAVRLVVPGDDYVCGGTLLENSWVLTAAHCMEEIEIDKLQVSIFNPKIGNRSLYRPLTIKSHHLYDFSKNVNTDDVYYDAALIKVLVPDDDSDYLIPACVSPTEDIDNLVVKVQGWGQIRNDTYPDSLQELDLTIFSNDECYYEKCYNGEGECESYNGDLMFCAGVDRDTIGKDTCWGDSGI